MGLLVQHRKMNKEKQQQKSLPNVNKKDKQEKRKERGLKWKGGETKVINIEQLQKKRKMPKITKQSSWICLKIC